MKKILAVLLLTSSAVFAQVPVATQNNFPTLDYLTADLITYSVTRFEMQIDSSSFLSIGLPPPSDDAKTLVGGHTYVGPKLGTLGITVGNHTFTSRACNAGGCGIVSDPLAFTYAPVPAAPANQRFR